MQEFDQRIEQATRQERLDFLRGIAALYVLINHCRGAFYIGGSRIFDDPHSTLFEKAASVALQVTSLGVEFVVLFFVLSGFAMAHSIRHTSDMGRFYLKRVVRIWPPYIAATFLALAIGILIGDPGIQARWLEVLFYLEPGTEVTPQFWSLPYEVLFYALCPFILATQGRVRLLGVIAAVLAVATIALFGLSLNPSGFLTNFLGNELLFFAAGALAYHHFDRVPRLGPRALLIAVAIGLAAMWAIKMSLGVPNMGSSLVMIGVAVLAIRNAPSVPSLGQFGIFQLFDLHLPLRTDRPACVCAGTHRDRGQRDPQSLRVDAGGAAYARRLLPPLLWHRAPIQSSGRTDPVKREPAACGTDAVARRGRLASSAVPAGPLPPRCPTLSCNLPAPCCKALLVRGPAGCPRTSFFYLFDKA